MPLIDSHCHLNADRFEGDVDLVIGGARLAGLERILVPGWNVASGERALALVDRFPWLDAAVGVHPHDAAKVDDAGWATVVAAARDDRVVAIGETGLDHDRVFSPLPDQLTNLRRNLALALETGKPAILHCRSAEGRRDAQDTLLEELRVAGVGGARWAAAFGDRPPAIIHSYSGPADYGRAVIDLGLAISFSGLVFRRGEEASADVAPLVPIERLLVETDSPFLAPPGAPRSRNEPEWVRVTAGWLAERRGTDLDTLGAALVDAYDRVFASSSEDVVTHRRRRFRRLILTVAVVVGPRHRGRLHRRRRHADARPVGLRERPGRRVAERPVGHAEPLAGAGHPERRAHARPRARRPSRRRARSRPPSIAPPTDRLVDVSASTAGDQDQLIFHFGNMSVPGPGGPPTGRLSVAKKPYTEGASGRPIDMQGERVVQVVFQGMSLVADTGDLVYTGPPELQPDLTALKHAVEFDESEGVIGWYIGFDGPGCVTISRDGMDVIVAFAHAG